MAKKQSQITQPNAGLELDKFDYTNLNGKDFEDYKEIESKLILPQKYDFEVWSASSVTRFRLNEETGNKEEYVYGLTLNGAKPIETTRISALQARELNQHVTHLTGNEHRNTSKYLLLKKPVKEVAEVAE